MTAKKERVLPDLGPEDVVIVEEYLVIARRLETEDGFFRKTSLQERKILAFMNTVIAPVIPVAQNAEDMAQKLHVLTTKTTSS